MSNAIIGRLLEAARQEFLKDDSRQHMVKSASAEARESWLDYHPEILTGIVDKVATMQGIDDPSLKRMVHSSLKFRILAGTIYQNVEYDDFGTEGFCKHQKMDPQTLNFECDPPNNKDAARNWHAAFGHNCACPQWEPPSKQEAKPSEIEKLFADGDSKYEALQELGIRNRKGDD